MPENGTKPDNDGRKWLRDVAIAVDELLQVQGIRQRFQQQLALWSRRVAQRPDALQFFLDHAMPLQEQYVRLAAVHDRLCTGAKRIDLCRTADKRVLQLGYARFMAGHPYAVLIRKVADITDADRLSIEKCFAAVRKDLTRPDIPGRLSRTAIQKTHPHKPSRPGKTAEQVRDEALAHQSRGKKFTTYKHMAETVFHCSESTLHKAVRNHTALQEWVGGQKQGERRLSRKKRLTTTDQRSRPAPTISPTTPEEYREAATAGDDTIWAAIVQTARPSKRAELNGMKEEEKRQFVAEYRRTMGDVYQQDHALSGNKDHDN